MNERDPSLDRRYKFILIKINRIMTKRRLPLRLNDGSSDKTQTHTQTNNRSERPPPPNLMLSNKELRKSVRYFYLQ